jgi:hypothetical protein
MSTLADSSAVSSTFGASLGSFLRLRLSYVMLLIIIKFFILIDEFILPLFLAAISKIFGRLNGQNAT